MKIREAMTNRVEPLHPDTTLRQAAEQMRDLNVGFLPVRTQDGSRLEGVVTDRDIVIRALANGEDPDKANIETAMTSKVLYCYENDDVESAVDSMKTQQVYRLIVLNNPQEKQLCGIVTLGDILRHDEIKLASDAAREISRKVA